MGFSRQEYWSGLPLPSLGNLPNPGIEPRSPALHMDSLHGTTREAIFLFLHSLFHCGISRHIEYSSLCCTIWTVARQAPLFVGFPRQEYWSDFPFPSPGDLLDLGIEFKSPALQADSLPLSHLGSPIVSMKVKSLSCGQLFAIPWAAAHQDPLSMGFSRQEY